MDPKRRTSDTECDFRAEVARRSLYRQGAERARSASPKRGHADGDLVGSSPKRGRRALDPSTPSAETTKPVRDDEDGGSLGGDAASGGWSSDCNAPRRGEDEDGARVEADDEGEAGTGPRDAAAAPAEEPSAVVAETGADASEAACPGLLELTSAPIDLGDVLARLGRISEGDSESVETITLCSTMPTGRGGAREIEPVGTLAEATSLMSGTLAKARNLWSLHHAAVVQRIGVIPAGDFSTIIVAAAPCPKDAVAAVSFIAARVKGVTREVPTHAALQELLVQRLPFSSVKTLEPLEPIGRLRDCNWSSVFGM